MGFIPGRRDTELWSDKVTALGDAPYVGKCSGSDVGRGGILSRLRALPFSSQQPNFSPCANSRLFAASHWSSLKDEAGRRGLELFGCWWKLKVFWNESTSMVYHWFWPQAAFSFQNNRLNAFLFHLLRWLALMVPKGEKNDVLTHFQRRTKTWLIWKTTAMENDFLWE